MYILQGIFAKHRYASSASLYMCNHLYVIYSTCARVTTRTFVHITNMMDKLNHALCTRVTYHISHITC